MRINSKSKSCKSGSGALFFAFLILPILLFGFTIATDLKRYSGFSAEDSRVVDEAALYGSRFLPFTAKAEAVAKQVALSYGERYKAISAKATLDTISVELVTNTPLYFSRLFGQDLGLPRKLFAIAKSAPFDVMIAFDRSSYLAPSLAGTSWNNQSSFFIKNNLTAIQNLTGIAADEKVITEQCFSQPFMELKQTTITLYEYFGSSELNRVAVQSFPGGGLTTGIIKKSAIIGSNVKFPETNFFEFHPIFNNVDEVPSETKIPNSICAAAAYKYLTSPDEIYLTPRPHSILRQNDPDSSINNVQVINTGNYSYNISYNPYLTAREVIWSKAVHQSEIADTGIALQSTIHDVVAQNSLSVRGGLKNDTTKVLFYLAGDVPWVQGNRCGDSAGTLCEDNLRIILNNIKKELADSGIDQMLVYYLVSGHPGNNLNSINGQSRVSNVKNFFKTENSKDSKIKVNFIYGDSLLQELDTIISALVLTKKIGVLAS